MTKWRYILNEYDKGFGVSKLYLLSLKLAKMIFTIICETRVIFTAGGNITGINHQTIKQYALKGL